MIDGVSSNLAIAKLQHVVGQSSVYHVMLSIFVLAMAALAIDYGRMLLLRRKMVRQC